MIHKILFIVGYNIKRPDVLRSYSNLTKDQWLPFENKKKKQEEQLSKLIQFSYNNVPYYNKMFDKLKIKVNDIKTIEDLNKLPILTKKIIKSNWQDFIPKNINAMKYINGSTGGSTGNTLQYRMSRKDYEIGISLLYRGWGYAGYKLGDKVAVIAGSSLIPNIKSESRKKIQAFLLNMKFYSSFVMKKKMFMSYYKDINKWKPKFIRGYASSIYLFTKFIKNNNLNLDFKPIAIFTTAEKLLGTQRKLIEQVFGVRVFDNYGLNDGGISAYECEKHNGMHIDMERAVLEVVDNNGKLVFSRQGKILATSLYNYALPFIRYDTGDLGVLSNSVCTCNRPTPLLKQIVGRVTDYLNLNNTIIGSPVLTVLMGKFDIEQYQIIQKSNDVIVIKIVQGKKYRKEDEEFIRKSFYTHVGRINIKFDYVDFIQVQNGTKHKFIINEYDI